ncbi:hypothetical protein Q5P01_009959 [Channa striata]|uniref:von Willebrand factor A domain-containing protein 5A-like n=1 Tax=Channa striata TaxID=64152 RepID=A0AA88N3M3_CHASR|nr:hypothetical protein Q5P01_009959 [Channa striata]
MGCPVSNKNQGETRIGNARDTLLLLLKSLPMGCYFNIYSFGSTYEDVFPKSVKYSETTMKEALKKVGEMDANLEGTEILKPLKHIYSQSCIPSQPRQSSEAAEGCVTVKYSLAGHLSQNQLHFSLKPAEDTGLTVHRLAARTLIRSLEMEEREHQGQQDGGVKEKVVELSVQSGVSSSFTAFVAVNKSDGNVIQGPLVRRDVPVGKVKKCKEAGDGRASLHSDLADTQLPKQPPRDPLLQLVSLQKASGCWLLDPALAAALGKSSEEVEKPKPAAVNQEVWATILALIWLHAFNTDAKDEWELLAMKAVSWLHAQNGTMMNRCGLLTPGKTPVPLKSIDVELEVRDHVATVVSTLNYENKEDKPLEAVFVFPLPGDAAVCHFSAKIGQTEIVAEVKEKQQAREEYDDALSSGQQAFLLEESDQSPDIFSLSVGSLPPGESASIRLEYVTELAVQADDGLRFCLPAVLNPRYQPHGSEAASVQVTSVPASLVSYSLSFSARVSSPRPITKVESSSSLDPLQYLNTEQTQAMVRLAAGHKFDRDVELLIYYKDAHQPTAVVEAGRASAKPGTLMGDPVVMVSLYPEFPQAVMSTVASRGEFVFLLDRSGSMGCAVSNKNQGESRIGNARDTLLLLLKSLPMGCYFNIYSFGSTYEHVFPKSVEYSETTMEEALKKVGEMGANLGGTEILRPLQHIYSQSCIPNQPRQLFVFTDGEVGNTKEVLNLVKKNSSSHRCFSFGIGEGASSALINGLATEGGGHAQFITGTDRMQTKVMQSLRFALQPAVENISVTWDLPKGVSVTVLSPPITSIFQGQRSLVYAQLSGQSSEAAEACVTVKYSLAGHLSQNQLHFSLKPAEDTGLTVHRLAARTLIRSLEMEEREHQGQQDGGVKEKVVELSVQSGVSSSFTAFVAVNKSDGNVIQGPLVRRDVPVGNTQLPKKPRTDPLLQLVSLQKASGCWLLDPALAAALGKSSEEVEKPKPAAVNQEVWATILALIWLHAFKTDAKDEWELLAMKAVSWLHAQNVPLKSIDVELEVRDHVATVVSTLNYENKEDKPLEAVFVFPLPGDAAVCHFSAKIGQTEIVAEVKEKQQAREEYDDALSSGQQAFLLEESDQSPDIFSLSVGSLPPGESASIRLEYVTELAVQADDGLRFCLPAVLNPRYQPHGSEAASVQVTSVPASLVSYSLSFSARVSSPRPITKVESSSSLDPLQYVNTEQTQAMVRLAAGHKFDRDVELLIYYKDAHQPTAVVEAGRASAKPGTLMGDPVVMVSLYPEFPQAVMSTVASRGEFVFLLDRSGSMGCPVSNKNQGETRIGNARDTLLLLLKSLPMGCYFNIYSFGSTYEDVFPLHNHPPPDLLHLCVSDGSNSVKYSETTMKEALKKVGEMDANLEGTEILKPLKHIYSQSCIPSQPRQLFVFTDGEVGNTKEVLNLVKKNSSSHRCFSFGIGEGASSALINGLATEGGGHAQFITGTDRMQTKVMQSLRFALQPVVENISVTWDLPKGASVTVLSPPITSIFQGQRSLVYAQLSGQSSEAAEGCVTVKYSLAGHLSQNQLHFSLKPAEDTGLTVHRLAARTLIRSLEMEEREHQGQQDGGVKEKVVELSVQSGVSSSFTAFVAVNKSDGNVIQGPLVHRDVPVGKVKKCKEAGDGRASLHSDLADTQLPKQPRRDPLLQLVSLQKASGCWLLDPALAAALGKSSEEVEKPKPAAVNQEVWATILALIWLHGFKTDAKDEWELLAMKAVSWLHAQNVPLKSIDVELEVRDHVATVVSTLNYENKEDKPLEAVFVFPLPGDAAVCHFSAKIGQTEIVAEVKEKQQAREEYDDALSSGQQAFLLEESDQSPDIFSLSVGSLPPGESASIRLEYVTELAVQADDGLRFCLPAVLNPRYQPQGSEAASVQVTSVPASLVSYSLSFSARVSSPRPITKIESSSSLDPLQYLNTEQTQAMVRLAAGHKFDRDVELLIYYKDAHQPTAVVEAGRASAKPGTLMGDPVVMVSLYPEFPQAVMSTVASRGEFVFLLDRSGSMDCPSNNSDQRETRIGNARDTLLLLLKSLPMGCYFNIYSFGSTYEHVFPKSVEYSETTMEEALKKVGEMDADLGGTEILRPLQHIYSQSCIPNQSRQLFVFTDGEVENTKEVLNLVKKNSSSHRCFSFGIGEGASSALINGLATEGGGHAQFITGTDRMQTKVMQSLRFALQPPVENISVTWDLPKGASVTVLSPPITSIFQGQRSLIYAQLSGQSSEAAEACVTVKYSLAGHLSQNQLHFSLKPAEETGLTVHRLAARTLIRSLEMEEREHQGQQDGGVKEKVVELSVQSGVSSSFTAFVAVNKSDGKVIQGPLVCRDVLVGNTQLPKQPRRDPLLQLVSLQKASGCWLLDPALAAALGKSSEEVEKPKPAAVNQEVWATILALIWLHGFKTDAKDEWELLAMKAVSWLHAQNVPLKSIDVELEVRDHVATVVSTLNYENKEDKPLEAVFVFPLPGDAAVCHFSAKIGQTEIVAEVKEKQQAREEYDDALSSGQQAFLLEESDQSPDIFSLSVGSLPPGESASIRLEYVTELAVQADDGLRFCLPAVLNPRYQPHGSEAASVQVTSVPASLVFYSLSFSARVSSPRPITKVESSSSLDPLQYLNTEQTQAMVRLAAGHKFDRDVELLIYYKDAHQPTAVVEAGRASAKPGTLMGDPVVMVSLYPEFPQAVMSTVASRGEFVFLLDRSGSMDCPSNNSDQQETRIGNARDTLLLLLKSLPMGCYFNIYSFGSSYEHVFPKSVEYSETTMEEALKKVGEIGANLGGTEILRPLQHIYSQSCIPNQPRQLFVFTDGEVGNTKEVLNLVKKNSSSHRCFSFGIGEGASSALINGLATEGGGHAQFITGTDRMQTKVMQSLRFALQPAVENISVTWDLPKGVSVTVLSPPITSIFQGQRSLVYAQLSGQSSEAAEGCVTVKYSLAGHLSQNQLHFSLKPAEDTGLTVHRLAARTLIRSLEMEEREHQGQQDGGVKEKVVELSVQSGVSSSFTAFVAVNKSDGNVIQGPLVRRDVPVGSMFRGYRKACVGSSYKRKSRSGSSKNISSTLKKQFMRKTIEMSLQTDGADHDQAPYQSDTQLPKQPPRDPLLQLVSLQKASGCWLLDPALAAALGKSSEEVEKPKPAAVNQEVWATILALIWLHAFKTDAKDEWELLAMKAVSWLHAQNAPCVTECVEAANALLGCKVQKDALGL